MRRATFTRGVSTRIGAHGRTRAALSAVEPELVKVTMAAAPMVSHTCRAASVMASDAVVSGVGSAWKPVWNSSGTCSARRITRSITDTASTGKSPTADSADSITASAPSSTALATSDTSARVGTGALIMDSSIWVATTTGLPAWRADQTMRF